METGELAQAAITVLEGNWSISDYIPNPITSADWFLATVFQSPIWRNVAIIIFLLRIIALVRAIKDANARRYSFWFQLLDALIIIIFTPILWIPIYIAIRPQWWKWDKTPWRNAIFQQVQICDNCKNMNQISNAYCTSCWESLQTTCHECQSKYSKSYDYCPNCWAPRIEE